METPAEHPAGRGGKSDTFSGICEVQIMNFNDIKLPIGRALGAAAVTLAAVSAVERFRKRTGAFGYFIAAAVSGAAALLLLIDKLGWDSQVADLKKFAVESGATPLDHLRSTFMRGKTEGKFTDDGTASYDGYDESQEDEPAEVSDEEEPTQDAEE